MKITLILVALVCFGCQVSSPINSSIDAPPIQSLLVIDVDEEYGDVLTRTQYGDQVIIYSINRDVDMSHRARVGSNILIGHRSPNKVICIGNPEKEFDCSSVGGNYQKRLWKDNPAFRNPAGQRQLSENRH